MAETITTEEWARLAQLSPERLRAAAAQQLTLADRALAAAPASTIVVPAGQRLASRSSITELLQQAKAELARGDSASGAAQLEAYKGAYSKARWALDELGPVLRAGGLAALFQELDTAARAVAAAAPATPPSPPPKTTPPAPTSAPAKPAPAAPPKSKAVEERLELLKLGPVRLRAMAIEQRDRVAKKLEEARGWLGRLPIASIRWNVWEGMIQEVNEKIERADAILPTVPNAERDKAGAYAAAFWRAREAALDLAKDVAQGNTLGLLVEYTLDSAETGVREAGRIVAENAKDAKELAGQAARGAGDTIRTGALMIFGALAIGLGVAAFSRFGSQENNEPRRRAADDTPLDALGF